MTLNFALITVMPKAVHTEIHTTFNTSVAQTLQTDTNSRY